MATFRRLRAVLGIKKDDFPGLRDRAMAIHTGLSDHPDIYTDPNPSLLIFKNRIVAFDEAQQLAGTRAQGSIAARNAKALELVTTLETERAYVQSVADENPEKAQMIIETAGMMVAGVTTYIKPFLHAKQDVPSGPVRVIVNVGALTAGATGKILFDWQSTGDGGLTWVSAPPSPYGHMDFEGLTPMHTYGFRVRFADLKGAHEWSQILTYLVL